MTQHTHGPWVWRGKSGSLHRVGDPPYQFGKRVLEPVYEYDSGTDIKVSDADAALIAAAPDLLSIVQRFVALPGGAWHPERHAAEEAELMQDARTAIARAKGETPCAGS